MNLDIREVLKERDGLSDGEIEEMIEEARLRVINGEDPEDVVYEVFGLEPDYIYDIM